MGPRGTYGPSAGGASARRFGVVLGACAALAGCGKQAPPDTVPQVLPTALLAISDGPVYDFGVKQLGTEHENLFVVTNKGTGPATQMSGTFYLSANFSYKGGQYPGTGGTCAATLDVAATCTVVIVFSPQYKGSFSDYLRVSYFDGVAQKQTDRPELRGQGS